MFRIHRGQTDYSRYATCSLLSVGFRLKHFFFPPKKRYALSRLSARHDFIPRRPPHSVVGEIKRGKASAYYLLLPSRLHYLVSVECARARELVFRRIVGSRDMSFAGCFCRPFNTAVMRTSIDIDAAVYTLKVSFSEINVRHHRDGGQVLIRIYTYRVDEKRLF